MSDKVLSRRVFLQGSLSAAAIGAVGGVAAAPVLVSPAQAADGGTLRPWSMAMHVHACFSEGLGSMEAQLDQASQNAIDVIWWSEHEFRMTSAGARSAVHFTGMTESESGVPWTWTAATAGSLPEKSATFVSSPKSPGDPTGGSLRLVGRANTSTATWATYRLNGEQQNTMNRGSLGGTTILLDVNPTTVGANAYLAVFVSTSFRPAYAGQVAGTYALEYRVGGDQPSGTRAASGRTGIVTLAATPGTWTTLTLDPAADLQALWPWIDGRDASLYTFGIGVGVRLGGRADAYVDNLQFVRTGRSGPEVLAQQADLMAAYASRFPAVTQHAALEWSMFKQHVNWYGGALAMPPPNATPWVRDTSSAAMVAATQRIHDAGGVASYNHPFGSEGGTSTPDSQSVQDSARRSKATELIGSRAYGCDLIEVGFPVKGGVEIAGYLGLWDALSRNGIFLTGTGVSDDHSGQSWLTLATNFVTWAWANALDRDSLTAALAAGRVYWGNPAAFRGQLDLLVDGWVPMGAVSVDGAAAQRDVRVVAVGLPAGSTVDLVRGVVDYAGSAVPDPVTSTTSIPATSFSPGYVDVAVDTTTSCFVRVAVRSSAGKVIAGSNPVWLLRDEPLAGVPLARRPVPPGPLGPRAAFTWTTDGRTVQLDASQTRAGDAVVVTYAWDFGDGTSGEGPGPTHDFAEDGTYVVVLTVTDESGLADVVARDVVVSTAPPPPPPAAVLSYVASARSNVNTKLASVKIPAAVEQGQGLLLFVTANSTSVSLGSPAGFTKIAEKVVGTQVSRVYTRTAAATDAGTTVHVSSSANAKIALELLVYDGIGAGWSATAVAATQKATATHPTPSGSVVAAGSWVVSYWVDKSPGTTTAWTPPTGVAVRGTSYGTAGGALATLCADSGQAVGTGPCGGLVATANASGTTAVTWTVVVGP